MPKVHIIEHPSKRPLWQSGDYPEYKAIYSGAIRAEISKTWDRGGRVLQSHELPKILHLKKKGGLSDAFLSRNRIVIFSERLKDLVESFDPKLHSFFPIEIQHPGGDVVDGNWFILNLTSRKKSVIKSLSGVFQTTDGVSTQFKTSQGPAVFSPNALKGAHIWFEEDFGSERFVSDELMKAIKEHEIKFFKTRTGKINL